MRETLTALRQYGLTSGPWANAALCAAEPVPVGVDTLTILVGLVPETPERGPAGSRARRTRTRVPVVCPARTESQDWPQSSRAGQAESRP